MRLPRRVPWASLTELEQICAAVYADENDIDSKIFAINRISAWKTVTSLPHALDSTLALLLPLVHDKRRIYLSVLQLRQSYATAVLRLVNGLVDPLQVGTYARPITSIAQQLGIPSWIVELRHASTHEDLPSLDLLREATRQSLAWLLQNYFLPIINPISHTEPHPVRPLPPLLKLYKSIMKTITSDLSLMTQYRPKLIAILRDLERWVAEAKVAANFSTREMFGAEAETDLREAWALEKFCRALADKGMLVPSSKRKRQNLDNDFLPSKASITFWNPLLDHMQALHSDFLQILCRQLGSMLWQPSPRVSKIQSDLTYQRYIACWVFWIMERLRESPSVYLEIKRDILLCLAKGISYGSIVHTSQPIASTLLGKICTSEIEFTVVTTLLSKVNGETCEVAWDPRYLDVMMERNEILHSRQSAMINVAPTPTDKVTDEISIPGWTVLEGHWECCPIGVYNGKVSHAARS